MVFCLAVAVVGLNALGFYKWLLRLLQQNEIALPQHDILNNNESNSTLSSSESSQRFLYSSFSPSPIHTILPKPFHKGNLTTFIKDSLLSLDYPSPFTKGEASTLTSRSNYSLLAVNDKGEVSNQTDFSMLNNKSSLILKALLDL